MGNQAEIGSADEIGSALRCTLDSVIQSIPDNSMRPSALARRMDVSRVMLSRTLSAVRKESISELLIGLPGPESLRSIVWAAGKIGVDSELVNEAIKAIDEFESVIKDHFGTRAAFNAAMSVHDERSRDQFEHSSRYQVYKGMSQIMGVQSKVWISTMIFSPSAFDADFIDIATIHGTSGLRRLRPDTPIQLNYGIPPKNKFEDRSYETLDFDLSQFYSNQPAPLDEIEHSGQMINHFTPQGAGGKEAVFDMIASLFVPKGLPKISPPERTRRGSSVIPDVPVTKLIIDHFVHRDVFTPSDPDLFVYFTKGTGKADIDDSKWDQNRVRTDDDVLAINSDYASLNIDEIPNYSKMVAHVCQQHQYDLSAYRVYRLEVSYPVFGFQYMVGHPTCTEYTMS
ncbi:MAG: hypothetical protein ACWA5W_10755 [Phycisphaerales bacterium]